MIRKEDWTILRESIESTLLLEAKARASWIATDYISIRKMILGGVLGASGRPTFPRIMVLRKVPMPHPNNTRRHFLKIPVAAAAAQSISTGSFGATASARVDEYDPANTKIATMVSARASDDHFLFLKQIGVRWVHVQFPIETNFELIKNTQDRLARFGIKIHCGIVDHYRSLKIQLGQPGRDEDIAKFQAFIRDLGRLGIYSTKIDFHPGNTYTTKQIVSLRGYRVREFDVDDFHKQVEK